MSVEIDHDKWLRAIAEEDPLPVGLLAVSPELLNGKGSGSQSPVVVSGGKVKALVLTFRVDTGASKDELASMTSHLMCRLSYREEELGGEGLELDVPGSQFGPDRVVLRLIPIKREGAAQRVDSLMNELNAAGRRAKSQDVGEDDDLGARIVRDFKSPLPVSTMKQLEMAAVA